MQASEIEPYGYLPAAFDNGYVVDVEDAQDSFVFKSGGQYMAVGDGMTAITFHNSLGDECYLIVPNDFNLDFSPED